MNIRLSSGTVLTFLILSAVLVLVGLWILFGWNLMRKKKRMSFEMRSILFVFCTVLSTILLKLVIGVSGIMEDTTLHAAEEVVNSFVHTMQAFSLNEDFTTYYVKGSALIRYLFPNSAFWYTLYAFTTSVQNICCTLSGGAIVYMILIRVFPGIRLALTSLQIWRPICYFSSTDEASLALAKSIRNSTAPEKKAIFIFCEENDANEHASQLIEERAKSLKGICVHKRLSEVQLKKRNRKTVFLTGKEDDNLHTLIHLTESNQASAFGKADAIYRFGEGNGCLPTDKMVRSVFREKRGDDAPLVFGINLYQNIVNYDILMRMPLFNAIRPSSDGKKTLHVVILGTGKIGTEAFLNVTWCGQIPDCNLHISVVSGEEPTQFAARINNISKDILAVSVPTSRLLQIYPNDPSELAPVYYTFDYSQFDAEHDELAELLNTEHSGRKIIDADYFIVSMGDDLRNISIGEAIGRLITIDHAARYEKVPIACVVYDDSLAKALNDQKYHSFAVQLFPVGMRSSTYSYERIAKKQVSTEAIASFNEYEKWVYEKSMANDGSEEDIYAYGSTVARAIHTLYKAYGLGLSFEDYRNKAESTYAKDDRLAWLEHRRWTAYMRSVGFRCPTLEEEQLYMQQLPDINDPADLTNKAKHKNLDLKLHPCIVECDDHHSEAQSDFLDMVPIRFMRMYPKKNLKITDFKIYDYAPYDFR